MSISSLLRHLNPAPPAQTPPVSRCSCTRVNLQRVRHSKPRATTSLQLTTATTHHTTRCSCSQWMHARKAFPDVMRWNSFPLEIPTERAHALTIATPLPPATALAARRSLSPSLYLSLLLPPCCVHVTRQQQQQLMILRSARNLFDFSPKLYVGRGGNNALHVN